MEKEKLSDFEEYIHNKIIAIYGDNDEGNKDNTMASHNIPSKVLKLVNEHNSMKSLFINNVDNSFQQSQEFYNNLMKSIQNQQKILRNCSRITTKYCIQNQKQNLKKNFDQKPPQIIFDKEFEDIDKNELIHPKEEEKRAETLKFFPKKHIRPLSTKNSKPSEFFYDCLQKKHMTRIKSAKQIPLSKVQPNLIQSGITNKPSENTLNSNPSFKSSSSKLKYFPLNEKFPAWALERTDFQYKLQCPEFNLNSKILKVCEKQ